MLFNSLQKLIHYRNITVMNVEFNAILLQICESAKKFSRLVAFLKTRKVSDNSRSFSFF